MKTLFNGAEEAGQKAGAAERYAPCLALLRAAHPGLSEAERRIADFVLANPDLVLLSSVTELARESGVGASTVTRLAVKLGYRGYPEFRTALAVELLNRDEGGPEPLREGDDAAAAIRKVIAVGVQNLHDTSGLLDPAALAAAAVAIVGARRVELYAIGVLTAAIAQMAAHRLLVLGIPCAVFTHNVQQVMAAGLLGPGDVAIGFSASGEGKEVVAALRSAGEAGATTICFTNVPRSSIARAARLRLLTAAWEHKPKDDHPAASMVGMTAAVDVLYAYALLVKHRRESVVAEADGPMGRYGDDGRP